MPEEPSKKRLRDRYNDARENMRDNKIVQHIRNNQTTYIVGALGVVGTTGALIFKHRPVNTTIEKAIAPVFNNQPVFNNSNSVNNGGYMRKIIRCVETDEMWPSMTQAAKAAGHSLQDMSKQIHGHHDHLDGLHYIIEGLAA